MHLVTLEYLEAGSEQILQFRVCRVRNENRLERAVDRLVISDFVVSVSLIELCTTQFLEFSAFGFGLLGERLAGVIVLRASH